MIHQEDVFRIGRLGKPHGVKGEITFQFTSDVWDRVEADYLILQVDGILVPFFLEEYRFRGEESALLKFLNIDTIEDVREYCGAEVFFPYALSPADEAEDVSYFEGFRVIDEETGELGTIKQIDDSTANVLFEIEGELGTILIPAVEEFIKDIDHEGRTITMQLPHGILEL